MKEEKTIEEGSPMIQVIAGRKGSGKTKRLIDLTNTTAREAIHDVIFLDDDNRYMFDVDHKVRFINAEDYHIHSAEMFIGFMCGIISSNFDLGTVFVDAFLKLCHACFIFRIALLPCYILGIKLRLSAFVFSQACFIFFFSLKEFFITVLVFRKSVKIFLFAVNELLLIFLYFLIIEKL